MKRNLYVLSIVSIMILAALLPYVSGDLITQKHTPNEVVSLEDAQLVALSKLRSESADAYSIKGMTTLSDDTGMMLAYVFFLEPTGYIVVPAYRNLPPVLAYSFSSSFGDVSTDNVLVSLIKTDVGMRLQYQEFMIEDLIQEHTQLWDVMVTDIPVRSTIYNGPMVGPLLDTKWHQNAPFKNFCPIDLGSGSRSVAGCPAVAMAQILNYHATTMDIQFTDADDYYHNYAGNSFWIDDDHVTYDFPAFPVLNSYLDTLATHYEQGSALTDDDKAALTFACGVAAKQVYNPGGSGTFGVNQAYNAYVRFGFTDVALLDENDPDVYDRLQDNILNGLPAHIAVVNEQWTVGHNMVVDGYNVDGAFHINFGWGGSYDGWYMLPDELPYDLTVLEGLVVDIEVPGNVSYPNLDGGGVLSWQQVKPGGIVHGNITIANIGDPESLLDWEVVEWPAWGTWGFSPDQGVGLTPEAGAVTIHVSVIVPDEKNKQFTGSLKIINSDDHSDCCYIQVSVKTPKMMGLPYGFSRFLSQHPLLMDFVQWLLNN